MEQREGHRPEVAEAADLAALLELSRALLATTSAGEVEVVLTELSVKLLAVRYASFLRYRPAEDDLCVTAQAGKHARELGVVLPRGQGLSWRATDAPTPVLRVHRDAIPPGAVRQPGAPDQFLLFAPLRTTGGQLLGVLAVGRVAPDFSLRDETLLATFANTGTVTLERIAQAAQAVAAREGALLALGLALEARDYETRGHTERTVALAERLGRALHLSLGDLDTLRQGAYLHDIGKLSVPDEILLKPGPLTPAERLLVQEHVRTGEALVRRIPSVSGDVLGVIRSHHERWDGAGYPDRLRGEAIPLLARIFAVVDVFDALTNVRPYHAARPVSEALEIIRAEAGRHFDPLVAAAFLQLFGASLDDVRRVSPTG
ncbi:HD domain-containing phosphohydrolase [Deinococcus hopiensis]|uniref:HDIG domain-containing protein n=1 Tax=Deinococcus hopiensis KR-140 TaxID=695939 RepID=A0A1W1VQL2_9DEIO|nr:HD domain-containing phosphohydrolase [Deinococcus hopiensis]SMB95637.1 HDIG domain-containing protein [Deinococcus hopiensis KR-140]